MNIESRNLKKESWIFGLLSCLYIFINYWYGLITIPFPTLSLSNFVILLDVLTLIAIIIDGIRYRFDYSIISIVLIGLFIAVILGYCITKTLYGYENNEYETFKRVLISESLMAIICACYTAKSLKASLYLKKLSPIISLIFSIVGLYSIVFHTGTMGGNWIENNNGLNYQTISYMAAISAMLSLYYIFEFINVKWALIFKYKISKLVSLIVIMIDFYEILICGGRGGAAAFVAEMLLFMFLTLRRRNKLSMKEIIVGIPVLIILVVFFAIIIKKVANSNFSSSGFTRLATSTFFEDPTRSYIRDSALALIKRKPIVGYGLGSVFYELGIWTHNIFTDTLLETGIVGLIILIIILLYCLRCTMKLIQFDQTNIYWLGLIVISSVESMFSGYYIANLILLYTITFSIAQYQQLKNALKSINERNVE